MSEDGEVGGDGLQELGEEELAEMAEDPQGGESESSDGGEEDEREGIDDDMGVTQPEGARADKSACFPPISHSDEH